MICPLYQQLILVLFIEHLIVSCQCTQRLGWTDKWSGHLGSNGIIFPQSGMGNGIIVYKHKFLCMIIFSMEIYLQLCTVISWCNIKQNWTQQEVTEHNSGFDFTGVRFEKFGKKLTLSLFHLIIEAQQTSRKLCSVYCKYFWKIHHILAIPL